MDNPNAPSYCFDDAKGPAPGCPHTHQDCSHASSCCQDWQEPCKSMWCDNSHGPPGVCTAGGGPAPQCNRGASRCDPTDPFDCCYTCRMDCDAAPSPSGSTPVFMCHNDPPSATTGCSQYACQADLDCCQDICNSTYCDKIEGVCVAASQACVPRGGRCAPIGKSRCCCGHDVCRSTDECAPGPDRVFTCSEATPAPDALSKCSHGYYEEDQDCCHDGCVQVFCNRTIRQCIGVPTESSSSTTGTPTPAPAHGNH
jgi:hypothetical protein